jgi:hypothetical protein
VRNISISITIVMFVMLTLVASSFAATGMNTERYERIVQRMVDAINEGNYVAVQRDFGEVMLNAFPLEVSRTFFENLKAQYGRIQRLDTPLFVPPEQAVFPAHCEKGILNIRVVLDKTDKIIGLWFMPQQGNGDETMFVESEVYDPNDPNAVARREWLKEVKRVIDDIGSQSEAEMRGWMDSRGDRRIERVRQMYTLVGSEFDAIRGIAVDEGAEKTVEFIDMLIRIREKRLEEIVEKIEEERRRERLRERERDRDSRRRDSDDRRRDSDDRRRDRDRTTRRSSRTRDY